MAATCAACMLPILTRSQLVVMETEVLHKRCVGQLTELWRSRQDAAAAVTAANALIRQATAMHAPMQEQYAALEVKLAEMKRRAVAAEQRLEGVTTMRDSLTQHNAELRRDMAALRLEIEARSAPAPVMSPTPASPVTPDRPVVDLDLDSAMIRFAMMELD